MKGNDKVKVKPYRFVNEPEKSDGKNAPSLERWFVQYERRPGFSLPFKVIRAR